MKKPLSMLLDRHRERTTLYYFYRWQESLGILPKPGERAVSVTEEIQLLSYWTIRRWENEG